jgi:hypothetical protein
MVLGVNDCRGKIGMEAEVKLYSLPKGGKRLDTKRFQPRMRLGLI